MPEQSFDAAPALAGLKDFQRRTVAHAFRRLYGEHGTSRRFLVADEVGLGKTLVARGIIARTREHLQHQKDRIDIIYICANAAIATQNINRLNIDDSDGFTIATRLTYLPRQVQLLRRNGVNFISLTPGTAFDHTRSRGGHMDERAILYRMALPLPWAHGARKQRYKNGLLNMLQATAGKDSWRARARQAGAWSLDHKLAVSFRRAVREDRDLYDRLKECCWKFRRYREVDSDTNELRYELISRLRGLLARVCLSALEPDLVIMDEFQRFRHLLDGEDDASLLANALFDHPRVRVLLLSATPYKMLTLDQESDAEDHYPDFIRTLEFLFNDADRVAEVRRLLADHRAALYAGASEPARLAATRTALERALLQVMCRTERILTTQDQNAMLTAAEQQAPLRATDLEHARTIDRIAACIGADDPVEYWKSAPYLLNFLKHYKLKRRLIDQLASPSDELRDALTSASGLLLRRRQIERYAPIDPANPRMRVLIEDTIEQGMWQLLWMPPSMPYTAPGGVFAGKSHLTKALVFSSWRVVPDAIASICSYEAERRMLGGADVLHSHLYRKFRPLLRFAISSRSGQPTGMPALAWMLPSPTLAHHIDPLAIARSRGRGPLSTQEMRDEVRAICRGLLQRLPAAAPGARADERWYWAAPILLDAGSGVPDWCDSDEGWRAATPDHEDGSRFSDHLDLLVRVARGDVALGPRPDDLAEVLCDLALAGPGVCALRALRRIAPSVAPDDPDLLSASARIASGFRSLFNTPETIAMLRGSGTDPYWRRVLRYGIDGNLQSLLDEYVHVLNESLGLQEHHPVDQVTNIAEHIQSVLALRTAQIGIDEITSSKDSFIIRKFSTRCRFALRFGDIRDDNNQALVRADTVRDAFNSPFRPFVLASTSIGQEGLDFHTWCHAVVHWNLPSNPVDLEQREGRVHRYKGHAVRKNIAERYGLTALSERSDETDPWRVLFQLAAEQRQPGQSDLIPYWIFEEGSARVERRVPLLPCSREVGRLKRLRQGLALYRMAFGQPRQEDLLLSLERQGIAQLAEPAQWLISLQPPAVDGQSE